MITVECHVTQHSECSGGVQFSTSIQCDKDTRCAGHEKKHPGIRHRTGNQTVNIFLSFIAKFSK